MIFCAGNLDTGWLPSGEDRFALACCGRIVEGLVFNFDDVVCFADRIDKGQKTG